jgi:predicted dehydrogenase
MPDSGHPRIALVGCGAWGRFVLRDLIVLGCEVTVVVRSERSRANATAGGAHGIVASLADLPAVDGAVVASPTLTRPGIITDLVERGIPVFAEKPLAASLSDAERLAALAPDTLFVMEKWRYHPGVVALRDIVRTGELGPVTLLRTMRVGGRTTHDIDAVWVLAPHDISIVTEVLGFLPPPLAAYAEVEGSLPVHFVGVLGEGSRPSVVFEISERDPRKFRDIRLHCAEGVAVVSDDHHGELLVVRDGRGERSEERRALGPDHPLFDELAAFVGYLGGGPPPRSSAAEALATVRCIAALRGLAGLSD